MATLKCSSTLSQSHTTSTSPKLLDHSLQVQLQPHSITIPKCNSKLTQAQPPSVYPILFLHGIPVHFNSSLITASKHISNVLWITTFNCISKVTLYQPPSSSLYSHNHLQSTFLHSQDHSFQVHFSIHLIAISWCNSEYTEEPPSASPVAHVEVNRDIEI